MRIIGQIIPGYCTATLPFTVRILKLVPGGLKVIDRDEFFRRFVDKKDAGIEIGASYNPSFPKAEGWNVSVVDYIGKDDLIEKYSQIATADTSRIEEVDHLAEGSSFSAALNLDQLGSFDYICGSHLLEHVCDFVGFFQECSKVLRESGRVLIAVPDKRFSFDFFRPLSTIGDVLRGHWECRTTHPADVYFQSTNVVCKSHGHPEWVIQHERPHFSFFYDDDRADVLSVAKAIQSGERNDYIDMHRWVFTPSSFLLILREAISLGLMPFDVEAVDRGIGPNIFASLKKNSGDPEPFSMSERMDLQMAIAMEMEVQAEFIRQSPQYKELLVRDDIDHRTSNFISSALQDSVYLRNRR